MLLVGLFFGFLIEPANSFITNCQNDCSGHGICVASTAVCICFESWNGGASDCSARELLLFYFQILFLKKLCLF